MSVGSGSGPGKVEQILRRKMIESFKPLHLEVINESPQHGLPLSAEKHFRVVIVADKFSGSSRIDRHRLVNECLAAELAGTVHALSVQAFTNEEWEQKAGKTFASPACLGGGKREGIS